MQMEWLQNQVTVEQAEALHTSPPVPPGPTRKWWQFWRGKPTTPAAVPFGDQNAEWKALVDLMHEGDQLWTFTSPPETWQALAGRSGVALVRDGRIVGHHVTLMN